MKPATVHLVGAGPGDPGLLTLRATRLLAEAELVLYDALVDRRILERVHPAAELVPVGKRAGGERTQSVLRWMLQPLRAEVLTHPEVLVGHAADAFDDQGALVSERYRNAASGLMARLAGAARARHDKRP